MGQAPKKCYTGKVTRWFSHNRHKYLLQYHVIFVCKYRKKLLVNDELSGLIKRLSLEICTKHNIIIKYMETDLDHIHYMMELPPTISISDMVRMVKSYTAYHAWHSNYAAVLKHHFWKEKTFRTDGYFVCSVGNVSEQTLKAYIENQG